MDEEAIDIKTREELKKFVDESNYKLWNLRGVMAFDRDKLGKEALDAAEKIGYVFGKAQALLNYGMGVFVMKNDFETAYQMLTRSLSMFREMGDKRWTANAHCILGIVHNSNGDREEALYNALKGVDFYETNREVAGDRVMAYYIIATIYKDLKKYEKAEAHFLKGTRSPDIETNGWSGRLYAGLANVYMETEQYERSLEWSFIALKRIRQENNTVAESRVLTDIGVMYRKQKKYGEALQCISEGLQIREKHNLKQFLASSHIEMAGLYEETGKEALAVEHLHKAEETALSIKQHAKLGPIYSRLSALYKSAGNFPLALSYSEKLLALNALVHKEEMEKRISNLQSSLLKEKEDEIERLKNVELKSAYREISEKNKEILDSIKYAKRIQQSLLPSEKYLERVLKRLKR